VPVTPVVVSCVITALEEVRSREEILVCEPLSFVNDVS